MSSTDACSQYGTVRSCRLGKVLFYFRTLRWLAEHVKLYSMSSWRKFLVIVLLALSLPTRSFAAIYMSCESSQSMGEVSSAQHMDEEMASGNAHHEHVMLANVSHR